MDIIFTNETYKAVQKAGAKSPIFHERDPYRNVDVESRLIKPEDYSLIKDVVKREALWKWIENRRVHRAIENLEKILAGNGKAVKIKTLPLLSEALRDTFAKTPNKFIFLQDELFGALLPYFVVSIHYHAPERYSEARANITLRALHRGKKEESYGKEEIVFYRKDLAGDTVEKILAKKGGYVETPSLMQEYQDDLKIYQEICTKTGEQYLARGQARKEGESKWHRDGAAMLRDGEPSRVVMDDQEEFGSHTAHHSTTYWSKAGPGEDEEESSDDAKDFVIPTHPIVRVFGLWQQEFFTLHTSNLQEYVYDEQVIGKIVLPPEHKRLIEALTIGTVKRMDDVVKGKARGIILLCTGKPGTGKTLTAEVYSEVAKRPLYTVQCSQLGTDPAELEKNLAEVLTRANRWRAILLIDEADVYIHERGSDIQQNAVVGVFLRLLEYYNGILFMNTNREEVIDDAIASRATAHVRYDNPAEKDAKAIWAILLKQYGVEAGEEFMVRCLQEWKRPSGRNIRQIIRLGKMIADREGRNQPTLADFRFAATFQDLSE
jgi:hypothetical protein